MIASKDKIYIAGHLGMVGSAIWRELFRQGYTNLIGKSSSELNLLDFNAVHKYISNERPKLIINAAAKVGGILANNTYPYEFLMENMAIQNNLISASHQLNIENFVFLGSSCIYPKNCRIPITETELLKGELETTNQWYAIAKISGIKLIESLNIEYGRKYLAVMPTNLYGPGDNFDPTNSHVLPALIRKFHEAKTKREEILTLWGSGSPMREFMHVDDLASGIIHLLNSKLDYHIYNIGSSSDISIRDLAYLVKSITKYEGIIAWDPNKPDGVFRKLVDSSRIYKLGWKPKIQLQEGIESTYDWYQKNINNIRG